MVNTLFDPCLPGLADRRSARRGRWATWLIAISGCCVAAGAFASTANTAVRDAVTVRMQPLTHSLRAYAQVEPTAVIRVRAAEAGVLGDLQVLPGSPVTRGEVLAKLGGPSMQALLVARAAALRSAQAREAAAAKVLAIAHQQLATHLGTRQQIETAQSELAAAQSALRTAQTQLEEAHRLQTLRAPAAGTVIAVNAANGEQALPGETVVTMLPAGKLWIRAAFYGADAGMLHPGMSGLFHPAGGDAPIPVRVAEIAPNLAPDGGRSVGLVPVSPAASAAWISGEWGEVALDGTTRQLAVIPTAALILDRGHWWVLVRSPQGDRPRQVIPGPARGWQTWIVSGLHPGEQVVAQDAFLEYHRGIAQTFQPPD